MIHVDAVVLNVVCSRAIGNERWKRHNVLQELALDGGSDTRARARACAYTCARAQACAHDMMFRTHLLTVTLVIHYCMVIHYCRSVHVCCPIADTTVNSGPLHLC